MDSKTVEFGDKNSKMVGNFEDQLIVPNASRTWPRAQVKSCIEFASNSGQSDEKPGSGQGGAGHVICGRDDLMTMSTMSETGELPGPSINRLTRTSTNPFLEFVFGPGGSSIYSSSVVDPDQALLDDPDLTPTSQTNSFSLISNDDCDSESSCGTLSEVFDSLSRFSELNPFSDPLLTPCGEKSLPSTTDKCSNKKAQQFVDDSSCPNQSESMASIRQSIEECSQLLDAELRPHTNMTNFQLFRKPSAPSMTGAFNSWSDYGSMPGDPGPGPSSSHFSLGHQKKGGKNENFYGEMSAEVIGGSGGDWQERCMELELALQRFGEQAARVRALLRDKLAELELRVVEAEARADEAEAKVRMMEQQLDSANSNSNGGSWGLGCSEESERLHTVVQEKERAIVQLECQVEEQRILRLKESRQVEEKAAKIKEWVSNKLRDLEEQNEHLREQNQKCETQLELLRARLSQLNSLQQQTKSKDIRHSTEDSSRGSYEGDRRSDESASPPAGDQANPPNIQRPLSATAACLAAIRRRSGAFDTPEQRQQRGKSNISSGSGGRDQVNRDSRNSRIDSGSVDMETPQSLSPRSPLDTPIELNNSNSNANTNANSTTMTISMLNNNVQNPPKYQPPPPPPSRLNLSQSNTNQETRSTGQGGKNSNNLNNLITVKTPVSHPVPSPLPVVLPAPTKICITDKSKNQNLLNSKDMMVESTQSLTSERKAPQVPPRKCRTRSPTPNTSLGTTPGSDSPHTETENADEEDATVLRARLDAECQQLARDLQAAVRELVRPEIGLANGNSKSQKKGQSSRAKARDENEDYSEIYSPSREKSGNSPPTPPMHRFPSWESRIYEIAAAGGLRIGGKFESDGPRSVSEADGTKNHRAYHSHSLGVNFSIPVYTTVKGRASQIRSAPFSGDSSDSSDGEDGCGSGSGSGPHPMSSGETDLSSPLNGNSSLSPFNNRSSSSPSKSLRRDTSFVSQSEISDDYAIPPDAFASETNSLDIALSAGCRNLTPNLIQNNHPNSTLLSSGSGSGGSSAHSTGHLGFSTSNHSVENSPRKECLEKLGYLTKLGGKLKTWRKRWFVLKNGTLTYWKSQQESSRRPVGREIILDENCRIIREEGGPTFEIFTSKKTYYLTADSIASVEEWCRVLTNVVRRNTNAKLVLSMEDKPTIQGWVNKVKNGHQRRVWCVLIGKMFLTFKSPADSLISGQINMRDARVDDCDHSDGDSDNDKEDLGLEDNFTIGIFATHQSPVYLNFSNSQEKDTWLYNLTIVSGKGPNAGTPFEQLIHKLMEIDGDPSSAHWKNPLLLHSKECISSPLTTLSTEALHNEALKLFKSCQLFMSVPLDSSGIDYHVALAQNALKICLEQPELQGELICGLIKQTSRLMTNKHQPPQVKKTFNKIKHSRHFLLNATQSLFLCDSSNNHGKVAQKMTTPSPTSSLKNPKNHQIIQNSSCSVSSGSAPGSPVPSPRSPRHAINQQIVQNSSGRSSPSPSGPKTPSKTSSWKKSSTPSTPNSSLGKNKKLQGPPATSQSVPSSPLLNQGHQMLHHSLTFSEGKSSVRSFVYCQGWQLLSLAVSLFLPKNSKLLWYLKQHLARNLDTKSECGKYAAYCQRSVERTLGNGPRGFKPSRMEVLSILMKNPFHHSLPHSLPVHFLNGSYQVVGFDGSTNVEEFLLSLCHQIGCRDPLNSGFYLYEDDPFEKDLEHLLKADDKICDVISQWESVLREKGSGRFETRRAVRLTFKLRIYRRSAVLNETEKERLFLCYQTNKAVVAGRFPLTRELALELTALMAQIDCGDYKIDRSGRAAGSGTQKVLEAMEKYYPTRYRDNISQDEFKALCDTMVDKWMMLKGKSVVDCVRIYLTCTRKWPFFGASLFQANIIGLFGVDDGTCIWVAICEDGIALLDSTNLQQICKFCFSSVQTFGGSQEDYFMIVIDDSCKKMRLLFGGVSKHKVLEMTRLVADYINICCCQNSIYGAFSHTASSTITRQSSINSKRFQQSNPTLPPPTPRLERKILDGGHNSHNSTNNIQRCDSYNRNNINPNPRT